MYTCTSEFNMFEVWANLAQQYRVQHWEYI